MIRQEKLLKLQLKEIRRRIRKKKNSMEMSSWMFIILYNLIRSSFFPESASVAGFSFFFLYFPFNLFHIKLFNCWFPIRNVIISLFVDESDLSNAVMLINICFNRRIVLMWSLHMMSLSIEKLLGLVLIFFKKFGLLQKLIDAWFPVLFYNDLVIL